MKRVISVLSVVIAVLFFLSGIVKLMGGLTSTSIEFFGLKFWYGNFTHPVFVVIFNFILGGALLYYSLSTFSFKKKYNIGVDAEQIDQINPSVRLPSNPLSNLQKKAGVLSVLLCLYFLYRAIALTAVMGKSDLSIHWPVFIVACVFMWSKFLIPLFLFGSNTMLNNKITAIRTREVQVKKRERIQARRVAGSRR